MKQTKQSKIGLLTLLLIAGVVLVYFVQFVGFCVSWKWDEGFASVTEEPPDLAKMLQQVQRVLGTVSSPELLAHISSVAGKDPGELARLSATMSQNTRTK